MENATSVTAERLGMYLGFLLSYCVFTAMLYLILVVLRHEQLALWQIALGTLTVAIIGLALQRYLK